MSTKRLGNTVESRYAPIAGRAGTHEDLRIAATKRVAWPPSGRQILSKYLCRSQSVTAFSYAFSSARKKCT